MQRLPEADPLQRVAFRCEDDIAFRETADLVRPHIDAYFAPRDEQIRMVLLFLGNFADAHGERHRLAKILKRIHARQEESRAASLIVEFAHLPSGIDLRQQRRERVATQRRYVAAARNALPLS